MLGLLSDIHETSGEPSNNPQSFPTFFRPPADVAIVFDKHLTTFPQPGFHNRMTTSNNPMRQAQVEDRSCPFLFFCQGGECRGNVEFIKNSSIPSKKKEIMNYKKSESIKAPRLFNADLKFRLINSSAEIRPILRVRMG